MKTSFELHPSEKGASLYTITGGTLTATITDWGATLVSLLVPDNTGTMADVVLGFDNADSYRRSDSCFGATVGRNANRIHNAIFSIGNKSYHLTANENENSLHSGPNGYHQRLWTVDSHTSNSICLSLFSPDGDQGFPGNATIHVTYSLDTGGGLHIVYDAVSDKDTVFNLTNHSYFNLAGQEHPERAMEQTLTLPGRFFTPADSKGIPTGELRKVADTPMDFRLPKPLGRDIAADYEPLHLQGGYDHNFEVFCNPCALLEDGHSGRTMAVYTDCPGVQLYTGNFIGDSTGKGGAIYGKRSGVCLETQFYPDSVNHPEWVRPITPAGKPYHSETIYQFN